MSAAKMSVPLRTAKYRFPLLSKIVGRARPHVCVANTPARKHWNANKPVWNVNAVLRKNMDGAFMRTIHRDKIAVIMIWK
jgi:hypothetical protein